jgi:hypothetical protein
VRGCLLRDTGFAHAVLSCRSSQQARLAAAISQCPGAGCFAAFAALRAGQDARAAGAPGRIRDASRLRRRAASGSAGHGVSCPAGELKRGMA